MLSEAASFDLILANILKNPLIDLAPAMARAAAPGARVILSGIFVDQADDVADVYSRAGFNEIDRGRIVDWTTIHLQR
jgi:ribosomal protein L11 methyltransferase